MKTISIHNIDDNMANLIQDRAKADGLSVSKEVKKLLRQALGIKPQADQTSRRAEYEEFLGLWDDKDEKEFRNATRGFERIDKDDWR